MELFAPATMSDEQSTVTRTLNNEELLTRTPLPNAAAIARTTLSFAKASPQSSAGSTLSEIIIRGSGMLADDQSIANPDAFVNYDLKPSRNSRLRAGDVRRWASSPRSDARRFVSEESNSSITVFVSAGLVAIRRANRSTSSIVFAFRTSARVASAARVLNIVMTRAAGSKFANGARVAAAVAYSACLNWPLAASIASRASAKELSAARDFCTSSLSTLSTSASTRAELGSTSSIWPRMIRRDLRSPDALYWAFKTVA